MNKGLTNFGLLECWPSGFGSANKCLGDVDAVDLKAAVPLLQPFCPPGVILDATGYVKVGKNTFVVAEAAFKRA